MRNESSLEQTRSLLIHALVATAAVVAVPAVAAVAAARVLPEPRLVLALLIGVLIAGAVASLGTSLWLRRPESVALSFGELMLWRFVRRRRAVERIASGVETLGLGLSEEPAGEVDLAPDHQLEVLHDLSSALETKDPYTVGHSRRVERHVYRTAIALGLHNDEIEELRLAASLHDVGKINIPDRILRKPASLTPEERSIVQQHAAMGASMVVGTVPEGAVQAILHHHESWDGTGYPDGLAAGEIPLLARIICVADSFDAMTSARPYKAGRSRREAIDELRDSVGTQFDAEVVEAFISTLPSAVPVAGAFAIFALPAESARRVTAWLKSTGGGSLSAAAGAAGMISLLGTATLVGTAPALPRSMAAPAPPPVHAPPPLDADAQPASEKVLDELFGPTEGRTRTSERVGERVDLALVGVSAESSGGPPPDPPPSKPDPPVIGQPSQPGEPQDPEPGPPEDPGPDPAPDPVPQNNPPSDPPAPPQDPSGQDECPGSESKGQQNGKEKGEGHEKAKGEGHSKHCH